MEKKKIVQRNFNNKFELKKNIKYFIFMLHRKLSIKIKNSS